MSSSKYHVMRVLMKWTFNIINCLLFVIHLVVSEKNIYEKKNKNKNMKG